MLVVVLISWNSSMCEYKVKNKRIHLILHSTSAIYITFERSIDNRVYIVECHARTNRRIWMQEVVMSFLCIFYQVTLLTSHGLQFGLLFIHLPWVLIHLVHPTTHTPYSRSSVEHTHLQSSVEHKHAYIRLSGMMSIALAVLSTQLLSRLILRSLHIPQLWSTMAREGRSKTVTYLCSTCSIWVARTTLRRNGFK